MSSTQNVTQVQDGASGPSPLLLQYFYEALILLDVLDPSVLARPNHSDGPGPSEGKSETAKFLDRLSWMCDFETGGLTVCAIAMQPTTMGTKFWFAIQHKFVSKTLLHLDTLLRELRAAAMLSESQANELKSELCRSQITYATKKVENYTRKLSTLVGIIPASDAQLLRDLKRLIDVAGDPIEFCSAADHFRDSESLGRISQKIKEKSMSDEWSSLRHCIGRLGSWHRAANTVVEYARAKPEFFEIFEVEAVEPPKPKRPPGWKKPADLSDVLGRMCPPDQESELLRAVNTLDRLRPKSDIAEEFEQAYADENFRPRVHAEVCLLEHFYRNSLPFVEAYRYIGCSKPSCYCCDLYFQLHPGQFVRRQSHGNVWTNWTSAFQGTVDTGETVLEAMTEAIRRDVKAQLYGPSLKQPRVPDSTTGLSSSRYG